MKFGRSYQMAVAGNYGTAFGPDVMVQFPTTLELEVTHHIFASANSATFSLYNLSETNQGLISFNQFLKPHAARLMLNAGYISQVALGLAGAPSQLPVIFDGFVNIAYTERRGPDLVTQINAFDNGDISTGGPAAYFDFKNAYTAPQGATVFTIFPELVRRLSGGVKVGAISLAGSNIPDPLARPWTFNGSVWKALENLSNTIPGSHVYIEHNKCYLLGQNATLPQTSNTLVTIESETGLLGIPRYTGPTIMVTTIFEPSLHVGSQVELKSGVNKRANGPCKIVAYTHRGTISGVKSGELYSDITLLQLSTKIGALNS